MVGPKMFGPCLRALQRNIELVTEHKLVQKLQENNRHPLSCWCFCPVLSSVAIVGNDPSSELSLDNKLSEPGHFFGSAP